MSLAWNTAQLLAREAASEPSEHVAVEYHLLSWRELYDKSLITADRYSSSAGEWVIRGEPGSFTVSVISRPVYRLPQELCVSFDCFIRSSERESGGRKMMSSGPPIDEVATEFSVLLSLYAREPLVRLGVRRVDNRPLTENPLNTQPPRLDRPSEPPPCGIDSPEFLSVTKGLAQAPEGMANAILAAAKFYHAGLSLITFDRSVAYTSLVSAIECLAGYHYRDKRPDFEDIEKFRQVRDILERINKETDAQGLVAELQDALVSAEHFIHQKFVLFLTEFVPQEFWQVPDDLYRTDSVFPEITPSSFRSALHSVYNARSAYLHDGSPFPLYVEFGLRERHQHTMLEELLGLKEKRKFVPPLSWFERAAHMSIIEFMRRRLVPGLAAKLEERLAEKQRVLEKINGLPENVRESLKKLTRLTARWLPVAVVNPYIPNGEWADSPETVQALKELGIVGGKGEGLEGSSWLKDREIGEFVGEFVYGVGSNPFRGNEILLPKGWPRQY